MDYYESPSAAATLAPASVVAGAPEQGLVPLLGMVGYGATAPRFFNVKVLVRILILRQGVSNIEG